MTGNDDDTWAAALRANMPAATVIRQRLDKVAIRTDGLMRVRDKKYDLTFKVYLTSLSQEAALLIEHAVMQLIQIHKGESAIAETEGCDALAEAFRSSLKNSDALSADGKIDGAVSAINRAIHIISRESNYGAQPRH